MVLKKFLTTVCLAIFNLYVVYPAYSSEYWNNIIKTAFQNDPKITEINSQYTSVLINKLQYDYSYIPTLSFTFQNTVTKTSLASVNILNETTQTMELGNILSPYLSLSLNQKLPLNGQLSLSADYVFNYSIDKNAYLQFPELTLKIIQPVSRGQWGMNKDPQGALINEQINYYTLLYNKQMTDELINILLLLKNIDILSVEDEYYSALVLQYESELKTAEEKKARGLSSDLETFYAEHEYLENLSRLHEVQNEKERLKGEVFLLLPDFNQDEFVEKKDELFEQITELLNSLKNLNSNNQDFSYEQLIENNTDSQLYCSTRLQYEYNFMESENRYAPTLYFSSSFGINQNLNTYYSDFSKSIRILSEPPYPVNLSFTLGFSKNFEFPKAKKLRNQIYELNLEVINEQIQTSLAQQKNEFLILDTQIKNLTEYLLKLKNELPKENEYRVHRKKLFDQNLITQDEYLKSETKYFQIVKEYTLTFWNIIQSEISLINMCSNKYILLNQFTTSNTEE